jgi:hypothetical protein
MFIRCINRVGQKYIYLYMYTVIYIYGIFGREINKYTIVYGVLIWF